MDYKELKTIAEARYRSGSFTLDSVYSELRCYPSSDTADIVQVIWWTMYNYDETPLKVKRSRGHSLRIFYINGDERIVRITDHHDYKNGVEIVS